MAIKKRPPVDPEHEARIEAFGAAAETPATTAVPAQGLVATPTLAQGNATRTRPTPIGGKTELKPMLIRFEPWEHELLREVAELDDRSMHNMAKRVLIPALEAIRDAHRS